MAVMEGRAGNASVTTYCSTDTNSLLRTYDRVRSQPIGPESKVEREGRERALARVTAELRRRGLAV